jgi:transposase
VARADTAALRQAREEPAVPTLEEEDAERPSLAGESPRPVNRMKSALARLSIGGVKPQLRKARQGLEAVLTPEDMPIPQNRLAEIRRDMAWLAMLREQIKAKTRLERLQQAPRQGPHAMVLVLARIIGAGVDNADMLVREILSKNSPRTCQEFAKDLRDEAFGGRRSVARYGYCLLLAG